MKIVKVNTLVFDTRKRVAKKVKKNLCKRIDYGNSSDLYLTQFFLIHCLT